MKRPAFQFYPADWRKDAALQSCSLAAQGLWINLLCIAHECEPYGHLVVNARPMTAAQIGRLVGMGAKEADRLLLELLDAGVTSMTAEGVIYSRRMVRDEDLRTRRADGGKAGSEYGIKGGVHGAKGGRPRNQQGALENPPSDETRGVFEPPKEPPPSSSSSSSSSERESGEYSEAPARAPAPPTESPPTTPAGAICRAMRQAGLTSTNPGDPRLLALIEQGATEAEFAGMAAEAVDKGKGWAWVLAVLPARRAEAAALQLQPPAAPAPQRFGGAADPRQTVPQSAAVAAQSAAVLDDMAKARAASQTPEAIAARRAAMAKLGRVAV